MDIKDACILVRDMLLSEMRKTWRHDAIPWDINNGWCGEFAHRVCKIVAGAKSIQFEDLDKKCEIIHYMVKFQNRYYDAECVNGVEDWKELPIYNLNPRPKTVVICNAEMFKNVAG